MHDHGNCERCDAQEQEIARLQDDIALRRGLAEGAQQLDALIATRLAALKREIDLLLTALVTPYECRLCMQRTSTPPLTHLSGCVAGRILDSRK